jgi:hypothetical protein
MNFSDDISINSTETDFGFELVILTDAIEVISIEAESEIQVSVTKYVFSAPFD